MRVQHWLGHESAAFTQKVCVHLRDRDLGSADFFDAPLAPDPVADSGTQVAPNQQEPAANVRPLRRARKAS